MVENCQANTQTFQGWFYIVCQYLGLMQATNYLSRPKNNQEQNFLNQILTSLFHTYWTWEKRN